MIPNLSKFLPRHFILYAAVLFLVEFVRGAFLVSFLPTYAVNQLGFSVATVGIAVSIHYITDTLLKSFAGYLLDRFSLRWIVNLGLCISFAGLLMVRYAYYPWVLVAAAAVFGIGISPIWLVCLSKVKPDNRASQMGMLYSFWLAGIGSGPIVINFIIDHSYKTAFILMLLLWAASWALSLFISNARQSAVMQVSFDKQLGMLWDRLRTMKSLIPGMILQTTAAGILVPILPSFAVKQLGLHYSQYSYILIAGGLCTMLFLIPMGKLSDQWGRRWFLIIGFSVFALSLYGLTLHPVFWAAVVMAAVLGLSYAAVLPAWNALLAQYVPKQQAGMGWGLFSSVEGIGGIIGPVLGGWLAAVWSENAAVLTSSVLLGFIAVYYLIFSPEGSGNKHKDDLPGGVR